MKIILSILFLVTINVVHSQQQIRLEQIATNVVSPVAMANAGDGTNRLFICEQHGVIRIIKNEKLLDIPFLDIREKIIKQFNSYSERGLLGIAFHPQYRSIRKFYVYYSASSKTKGSDHKSIVAEFQVSLANNDIADKSSERIIMEIEEPESNHNGGQLVFGPDGFLYIGIGDGGGAGDKHGEKGNGQNMETLLGKIIRIDVNTNSGYKIPSDNPFVGKPGRDEIWAYGLRNPWKFSFDKVTGKLFCADVGQDTYEEVDIIQKGKNYGWRVMEAFHCYDPKSGCDPKGMELPISEYNHSEGVSVIGGYVYRGNNKSYNGKYLFADWSGKVFMLSLQADKTWKREQLTWDSQVDKPRINSMGEDENGELYLLTLKGIGPSESGGIIYKIKFLN